MTSETQDHVCPVCGMAVAPGNEAATVVHEGQPYYFCSEECAGKFRVDPTQYVGESM